MCVFFISLQVCNNYIWNTYYTYQRKRRNIHILLGRSPCQSYRRQRAVKSCIILRSILISYLLKNRNISSIPHYRGPPSYSPNIIIEKIKKKKEPKHNQTTFPRVKCTPKKIRKIINSWKQCTQDVIVSAR